MAHFTLGMKANVQPKSSIPISVKVKIKGFTLGVKVKIEKKNSIYRQVLINVKLYGHVMAPWLKKRIPSNLGSQSATLGANVHKL
jgi:hypothetical protein